MTGQPSWFEIGSGDAAQGRAFYEALFGWEFESFGDEGGEIVRTEGMSGGIHGGDAGGGPYLFFEVVDLAVAIERLKELGGEVDTAPGANGEPTPAGRFILCRDDQGSSFGLHEPPPSD
jgi:predicted enzyme related to lactoylglutathione lyase